MEKMIFLVNCSVRWVKVEKDTLKWNLQEGKQKHLFKKSELLLDPLCF